MHTLDIKYKKMIIFIGVVLFLSSIVLGVYILNPEDTETYTQTSLTGPFGIYGVYAPSSSGVITSNFSYSLCPELGNLEYQANLSRSYNFTTNTITEYGVLPVNMSLCNYTYNLTNSGSSVSASFTLNATLITYNFTCAGANQGETVATVSSGSVYVNCTLDFINASTAYHFNVTFTGT